MGQAKDASYGIPLASGTLYYVLTSLVVFVGGCMMRGLFTAHTVGGRVVGGDLGAFFLNWDGQWFKDIAINGYTYIPDRQSSVNFFPAYPAIARATSAVTGLDIDVALVVVANLCLLTTFIILGRYVQERFGAAESRLAKFVMLAFGLAPPSFFFRVAYSESLLLLVTLLALYGMCRRWPLAALAMLVGLATAVRPVGVALVPALAHHVWTRQPKARAGAVCLAWLIPLALWGLAAYMAYLYFRFGDPFIFVESHRAWNKYPDASFVEKVWAIETLHPFWSRFIPSSPAYWARHDGQHNPILSLYLADPFYFFTAVFFVVVGARRGWLTTSEILVSVGLLGMPMALKCYETNMEGFARYAAVVLPVYLVVGKILSCATVLVAMVLLIISCCLLAIYTALFAQWYVLL
ncbi:MAG: hypothetical protein P4L84_03325 [Isosphaeraceae bacterium]|nr:hypothetical protein [Isosphaeraceae bacterium]